METVFGFYCVLLSIKHDFNTNFTQFYNVSQISPKYRTLFCCQFSRLRKFLYQYTIEKAFDVYLSRQHHEEIKEFIDAKGWWFRKGLFDS